MKIHQVALFTNNYESLGYAYFTRKTEASRFIKGYTDETHTAELTATAKVPLSKKGVMAVLYRFACHADNG